MRILLCIVAAYAGIVFLGALVYGTWFWLRPDTFLKHAEKKARKLHP